MEIYINGVIHTLVDNKTYEAMRINNGLISDIGSTKEILKLSDNQTQIIDLKKQHVYPGLIDSHIHLIGLAIRDSSLSLQNATGISDIVNHAKTHLDKNKASGEWLIGYGWNHDYFDNKKNPNRHDLDLISQERPICFVRACTHICVVNTKALELLGLFDTQVEQIKGGSIEIGEDSLPTGILCEAAVSQVMSQLKKPSKKEIQDLIIHASNLLAKHGITSVHTDDLCVFAQVKQEEIIDAYESLAKEKKLPIRIYQQCLFQDEKLITEFLNNGYFCGYGDDFYKLGPAKFLIDGSLGARTALLRNPYLDDSNTNGISVISEDKLSKLVSTASQHNFQIAIHGIGDLAIEQILDQFQRISTPSKRHGIIHCQITKAQDLERIKELDALTYVQPIFLDYDQIMAEARIGQSLAKTSYAFNTMIDLGIHMSIGSDAPVDSYNPFENIYCATTRKQIAHQQKTGFNEAESISIKQALHAFTYEGAYASFEESKKGSLSVGYYADFFTLDENLFEIDPQDLLTIEPNMTYVNGKCVYTK